MSNRTTIRPSCIPAWIENSRSTYVFVASTCGRLIYSNSLLTARTCSGQLVMADIHYGASTYTPQGLIKLSAELQHTVSSVKCVLMSDVEVFDLCALWEFSTDVHEGEEVLVGIGMAEGTTSSVSDSMDIDNIHEKIAQNMPGFVYQFEQTPDGRQRFPFVSTGVTRLFGVSPGELRISADLAFERVHEDDAVRVRQTIQKSARELSIWNMSFRVQCPNLEIVWLQGIATPERLHDGSTLWHGYIFDITEQKKSEEKLLEQSRKLDEIAFIQAHEFRRPVANMLGIFDILQIGTENPKMSLDQLMHWLRLMKNSVEETDQIIAKIVSKTADEKPDIG